MEFNANIISEEEVNEANDYHDFVNRRRTNKKSIRTKVTTLMENGEVHSEIMGTKINNEDDANVEQKLSADGNNEKEVDSNFQDVINGNDVGNSNTAESPKKDNVKFDTKKDSDTKNKSDEDRTVFGMKPVYGYSLITIIALVGITAAVKIFKNNKPKLSLN